MNSAQEWWCENRFKTKINTKSKKKTLITTVDGEPLTQMMLEQTHFNYKISIISLITIEKLENQGAADIAWLPSDTAYMNEHPPISFDSFI